MSSLLSLERNVEDICYGLAGAVIVGYGGFEFGAWIPELIEVQENTSLLFPETAKLISEHYEYIFASIGAFLGYTIVKEEHPRKKNIRKKIN